MVPLNYNQLFYFYRIAKLGSISNASKELLLSSPGLSMQLKELEAQLGKALFLRSGKKLLLTEVGSIVFDYAHEIFNLGHELKDTLEDIGGKNRRQKIEIGIQDTIPKSIADELLAELLKHAECKVVVLEGNRERLLQLQGEFKLDLILINSLPDKVSEARLLCKEELVVVGHPKWECLKSKWPSSMEKVPWILPTFDSSSRQLLENFFTARKILPEVVAEVEDKATEIDLAKRGLGLATSIRSGVAELLECGTLKEIGKLNGIYEEIWMISGQRKLLNPLASWLIKNFRLETHC